ncbi:MAG: hypothetical protein JW791_01835 [Nanoarchaeota archaeon]|nr:hypothetical protein [Nanoarchaeota archaeon]
MSKELKETVNDVKKEYSNLDLDKRLFERFNELVHKKFNKYFKKYFDLDDKKFINKINRDYAERNKEAYGPDWEEKVGEKFIKANNKFPTHVVKTIKSINKRDYDFIICILRGALPYTMLFEIFGWKGRIKYVICGRKKGQNWTFKKEEVRYDEIEDLSVLKGKKVLLVENNIATAKTPLRVFEELKNRHGVESADLFIDYIAPLYDPKIKSYVPALVTTNPGILKPFNKRIIALNTKVSSEEDTQIKKELLEKLNLV